MDVKELEKVYALVHRLIKDEDIKSKLREDMIKAYVKARSSREESISVDDLNEIMIAVDNVFPLVDRDRIKAALFFIFVSEKSGR